jgi:hypothetical protein
VSSVALATATVKPSCCKKQSTDKLFKKKQLLIKSINYSIKCKKKQLQDRRTDKRLFTGEPVNPAGPVTTPLPPQSS